LVFSSKIDQAGQQLIERYFLVRSVDRTENSLVAGIQRRDYHIRAKQL
jgi:hypothetical protein